MMKYGNGKIDPVEDTIIHRGGDVVVKIHGSDPEGDMSGDETDV